MSAPPSPLVGGTTTPLGSPMRQSSAAVSSPGRSPATPASPLRPTSNAVPLRNSPNSQLQARLCALRQSGPLSPSSLTPKKLFITDKTGATTVTGLRRVKRIPLIYPKLDAHADLTEAEGKIVLGLQQAEALLDRSLRDGGAFPCSLSPMSDRVAN